MKKKTLAEAFKALSDAIDVIEVGELIGEDDIEALNDLLRTRRELKELIPDGR